MLSILMNKCFIPYSYLPFLRQNIIYISCVLLQNEIKIYKHNRTYCTHIQFNHKYYVKHETHL